ncbi:ribonuclease E/G [Neorhizobium galegae]|uniref:Rne/Rng family ribonuclease n=1 Tax=Neorhizobium galegae TaxID=399 RepID=UPI0006215E34|nr:ribonuclease E/G [Neorhizobium galegae]CDZ27760.1 Ribonuclease, Rne/Rng family [Neorhizobium galegae bv. officinalis]KAA9386754.1 Rne/Rng family ribonuclease [Neorhizobium galegae]KAB1109427.1 Rne/Rng family ribonuclease [Neorhizobium galegae]MCM2501555.1 Rne/Rng family ribonuclease [Neorhizobium galegae]MCQ1772505.1 Rne/Rng family ribonuclease [Neorhizobium galegae]
MADKMLIDASHEEETRVVVVRGNRIEEFDFESQHKKQIRGNIYLAKVTRVEPSLQAAFVDYGGNRHGFLAFAEIHPDYYQIPLADRQALMQQEAEDQRKIAEAEAADPVVDLANQDQPDIGISTPAPAAEPASEAGAEAAEASPVEAIAAEETEKPKAKPRRSRARKKPAEEAAAIEAGASEGEGAPSSENNDDDGSTPGEMAAMVETDSISEDVDARRGGGRNDDFDDDDDDDHGEKEIIESVGAEDAMEEVPDRVVRKPRKQYRIQEVIKRRQILLVQVAKEERGNKGAALTTYLSLAGRYSVLMPNTARGGGISRKITQPQDRKRLKEIARELDVPQGMGVILRTAGANRTRVEVKRDFEYLMRLWENVRTLTLNSTAPCLVYEEGSLIKRSIRDLYNKDISEIIVSGEEGYREAKDFMKMLMPSHAKVVQPYRDLHPIFARSGIEAQLDRMLQPQVTLKSGGYLIMNQTEALVAIDVNSGRSTREHSIEETALQTNLEAAEEVARQLRLRDLAGLIVIDFIDMEEKRNNRAVEKRLKDCLKNDRARIQVGRISHFGLLEMSRQRIRASVLESTTQICTHCGGTGHVRSQSSVALHVLRGVEEYLLKNTTHDITVRTTPEIALYLLNHKRSSIVDYENRFGVSIFIESDVSIGSSHFAIDRGEPVENPVKIESLMQFAAIPVEEDDDDIVIEADEDEEEEAVAATAQPAAANAERTQQQGDDQNGRKRKRRRRRRNRGGEKGGDAQTAQGGNDDMADGDEDGDEGEDDVSEAGEASDATVAADSESEENRRKRRRRGKRGGRRNRTGEDGQELNASEDGEAADEDAFSEEVAAVPAAAVAEASEEAAVEAVPAPAETEAATGGKPEAKPRRSRRGKAATAADTPAVEEAAVQAPVETAVEQVEAALGEEPQAPEAAPVEAAPAEETPVAEAAEQADSGEAKPARANRASNISSSVEAVVKSSDPAAAPEAESDPSKPKKAGWWQRRGFF